MAERERHFTVISNENMEKEREKELDYYKKERMRGYQTNPLREKLVRYTNEQESGRRFSIEDLLKW